jgi:hypothetical protein
MVKRSLWSPNWHFDEATYLNLAGASDNADFVDVVIHSYRRRFVLFPATLNMTRCLRPGCRTDKLGGLPVADTNAGTRKMTR